MGRPGPIERLNRVFRDHYGSKAVTTQQGRLGYDPFGYGEKNVAAFLQAIHKDRWSLEGIQIPYRNKNQCYLMQEIYAVCFLPGTLIRMADGSEKPIEKVRTRDSVVTAEGNLSRVVKTMVRRHTGTLRRLLLWGHRHLVATPEHPILTKRGYVPISELTAEDWVALPRYLPRNREVIQPRDYIPSYYRSKAIDEGARRRLSPSWVDASAEISIPPVPPEIVLNENFGRILGFFLAEGHTATGKVEWTFSKDETETLVRELFALLRSFKLEPHLRLRGSAAIVTIYGVAWSHIFATLCEKLAGGKRLHPDLCCGPEKFLAAIFKGWMDGDGHREESGRSRGTTVSHMLAMGMYDIAQGLGWQPTISYRKPTMNDYAETRQPSWHVALSRDNSTEGNGRSGRCELTGPLVWRRVREVEPVEAMEADVFNLEVEGDNSYIAEGIAVHNCSPLARGIQELAGDAANDSQADTQPDAIVVAGETETRAKKIEKIIRDGFRRLKIGENGSQRHRIALRTGNCFGQKVFEWDGSRWHMTKILHMPTYQMLRNPQDDSYVQMSVGGMASSNIASDTGVIARWPSGFIANLAVESDHNAVYGVPILEHVRVDYRLFIAACEDAASASRSRAPMRFKWKYGSEKGFMGASPESLQEWRDRQQIEPTTVLTDIWLIAGWEDVEAIGGDAAGVAQLMMQVNDHMHRMKKACGFRVEEEDLAGAGRESGDSRYSSHINTLRIADWKFKKSVGDDLLILEGYPAEEIDWSTNIPPLGETDTNRVTRASNELKNAHGGLRTYAAAVGVKSVDALKDDIRETKEFYDDLEIVWPQGNKVEAPLTDQERSPKGDVPGTESPKKGSDPEKGRQRREQQRRAGRTPTGA